MNRKYIVDFISYTIISFVGILLFVIIIQTIENNNLNEKINKLEIEEEKLIQELKEKRINIDNEELKNMDLTDVDNLMVVAHPDDEFIFGGAHLMEDKYLVVCVTCGSDEARALEFSSIMEAYNQKYLMLNYVDVDANGNASDWGGDIEYKISRSLKEIVGFKHWKKIVTHNLDGEYGHWHHIATSVMITDLAKDYNESNSLYYFGKYYTKDELKNNSLEKLSDDVVQNKRRAIKKYYPSQKWACLLLEHIYKYENWIKASEWKK